VTSKKQDGGHAAVEQLSKGHILAQTAPQSKQADIAAGLLG